MALAVEHLLLRLSLLGHQVTQVCLQSVDKPLGIGAEGNRMRNGYVVLQAKRHQTFFQVVHEHVPRGSRKRRRGRIIQILAIAGHEHIAVQKVVVEVTYRQHAPFVDTQSHLVKLQLQVVRKHLGFLNLGVLFPRRRDHIQLAQRKPPYNLMQLVRHL